MGRRVGAALVAMSLLAASCSGDQSDAVTPSTTTTPPEGSTTAPPTTAAPVTTAAPSTTATTTSEPWPTDLDSGWEEAWAADRQAVIDRLTAGIDRGDWGVGDDNVLRGPGNLEIDLNACPPDWDPTEGVSDDEIVLGAAAWFGGLASYGWFPGAIAYIDEVNAGGGIGGRAVRLRGYEYRGLPEGKQYILGELDRERPISISGRTLFADFRAEVLQRCIPAPASEATTFRGATPRRSDFEGFMTATERAEVAVWVRVIAARMADRPVQVLAVVEDDAPFSDNLLAEFVDASTAAGLDVTMRLARHGSHDFEAPPQFRSLDAGTHVVALMTAGTMCGSVMEAMGDIEASGRLGFVASPCRHDAYMQGPGSTAEGWLSAPPGTRDLAMIPGPYGDFLSESSRASDGIGWLEGSNSKSAYAWAWLQVELLRIAAELPGGLTRPNLLLAMWTADLRPPHHQPGVRYQLNGFDDPEPIETDTIERWNAEMAEWIPVDTGSGDG